jgi:hypothetical protein
MQTSSAFRSLLLAAFVAASTAAGSALAQLNVNISLAPPAPQFETVPVLAPGQVWAPGYWAWNGDRYIWVRGRSIVQRTGYRWEPDRWEHRNGHYYRHTGRWARDGDFRPVKVKKAKHHKAKHFHAGHGGGGKGHGKGRGKGHGKHG